MSSDNKYTISEDTLDYLDTQIDDFNDTDNLGQKIAIHNKLKAITDELIQEIDLMVEIIDNIDDNTLNNEFYETKEENDDINDNIIKLEDMIENMEEEKSLSLKINHYKRIIGIVNKCKKNINVGKINVLNVN